MFLPDDDFLRCVYEQVIRQEDCVAGSENRDSYSNRLRYLATLLALAPEEPRALDFGSGAGVSSRILAACDAQVTAYEPSAGRCEYAKTRNIQVVTSIAEVRSHAPYSIVILDNVLEHVPEPRSTMRLIREVLADGAFVYVSVPSYEPRSLARQLNAHLRGEALDMTINPWEHLNYFSLTHLDLLMGEAGLSRLRAADLPEQPPIGLRPEKSFLGRSKNSAASIVRLARYICKSEALASTERAFYRAG